MPSSFAAKGLPPGLSPRTPLVRTPSVPRQAARRRLAIVVAFALVALASAAIGTLVGPRPAPAPVSPHIGPFSYIAGA